MEGADTGEGRLVAGVQTGVLERSLAGVSKEEALGGFGALCRRRERDLVCEAPGPLRGAGGLLGGPLGEVLV